jgi:formate dehydrogenase
MAITNGAKTTTEPREVVTFCRICEALCGVVATVEDGRVTKIRGDTDHPISKGFICPKGTAMTDVQDDPDRLLRPLKRQPDGSFEPVSWSDALDDIGRRLRRVIDDHGPSAVAFYSGNPAAFSYSHFLWTKGFLDGIGSPQYYWAGTQDGANIFSASAILYGTPLNLPIPDIDRTDFLLMIGANPFISHGSAVQAGRIKDKLLAIPKRGGRIVCVDPRRTETARQFEWLPIHPDSDAWFLLGLLNVILDEGLEDRAFLARHTTGLDELKALVGPHTPEAVAGRTGMTADAIRSLARDFAGTRRAVVYGRTGSCLGRYSTLVHVLLNALNIVTGNLDRPGGAVFGTAPLPVDILGKLTGLDSFGSRRSRVGGFADIMSFLPGVTLAKEIATPGPTQIKALFSGAGNPVNSIPGGPALVDAFGLLDLHVSLDIYLTESNRHADYVLPCATWLERDDVPLLLAMTWAVTPWIQYTEAVVPPPGETKEEWWIIEEISKRIGVVPSSLVPVRWLGKLGVKIPPRLMLDLVLRTWITGDWFGLRRNGIGLARLLRDHPHGKVTHQHCPTGVLRRKVKHKGRRIPLADPITRAEMVRLGEDRRQDDPDYPLRLVGLRELRSHNSWMHNSPRLMGRDQDGAQRRHAIRIHPVDAAAAGLEDGAEVRVTSKWGSVTTNARITDEMNPGTIAMPHGWGHRGGWRTAEGAGGATSNDLMPTDPAEVEQVIGHAVLNGIAVNVAAVSVGSYESNATVSSPEA